eukprot:jgi/Botrbrau1/4123/Bobra.152_3s0069.1
MYVKNRTVAPRVLANILSVDIDACQCSFQVQQEPNGMCGLEYTHRRQAHQASKKPFVETYDDGLWHPWPMRTMSLIICHNPEHILCL